MMGCKSTQRLTPCQGGPSSEDHNSQGKGAILASMTVPHGGGIDDKARQI